MQGRKLFFQIVTFMILSIISAVLAATSLLVCASISVATDQYMYTYYSYFDSNEYNDLHYDGQYVYYVSFHWQKAYFHIVLFIYSCYMGSTI